jgi:predicted N-acetyltransferase YhbS
MKIKIRRVNMCDVKELLPLISQLGYPTTEENLIARIALYQLGQNDFAWVATEDESIIGCIALHLYDLFHSTERYARIVSLVVNDSHRRKGIGKRLLQYAEKFASKKNCSMLELSTSLKREKFGAPTFYGTLGYQNQGEFQAQYLRKYIREKEGPFL